MKQRIDTNAIPEFDMAAVTRVGERLDAFAATLPEQSQRALSALLSRAAYSPLAELAALPPTAILDEREQALLERLEAEPAPDRPGPRASLVLIMKATRLCNLRCTYCHAWKDGPNQVMEFPVLARTIRDALRDPGVRVAEFVWHGGEVTLLPVAFYRKALWLQERFRRPGQRITNSVQTNGTRLTDEWLEFLRRYRFEVGVSLDGPPEIHDRRRLDVGGRPTSARVREGLRRLHEAGISWSGVLMVVDDEVCDLGAERVLEYLLEIGVRQVGLLNVVPDNAPPGTPLTGSYLRFSRFIAFLRDIFRLWYPQHVQQIVFRELADLANILSSGAPRTCFYIGNCFGGYLTVDPNGEVTSCDKYIGDANYRFGNVLRENLAEIQFRPSLIAVQQENHAAVERQQNCPWFTVCRGACPHDRYTAQNRMVESLDGCCGYGPLLADMAAALAQRGHTVFDPAQSATKGATNG